MKEWIAIFFSVFAINVIYAYYIKAVEQHKEILSAILAVFINIISSIAVIFYVNNYKLLIPSCLATFLGTIVGVKISKKIK